MAAQTVGAVTDKDTADDGLTQLPGSGQEEQLTSEERWNIIWACVSIYYAYDAFVGVIIALVAFAGGMLGRFVLSSDCDSKAWIISLVIIVFRLGDVGCGCCGILRNPVPTRKEFFWDIIRNILLCMILGCLGLANLIVSALKISDENCRVSAIIGALSGAFLMFQSAQEFVIWNAVLCAWCVAGTVGVPVPSWCDKWIPKYVKEQAMKNRSRSLQ